MGKTVLSSVTTRWQQGQTRRNRSLVGAHIQRGWGWANLEIRLWKEVGPLHDLLC